MGLNGRGGGGGGDAANEGQSRVAVAVATHAVEGTSSSAEEVARGGARDHRGIRHSTSDDGCGLPLESRGGRAGRRTKRRLLAALVPSAPCASEGASGASARFRRFPEVGGFISTACGPTGPRNLPIQTLSTGDINAFE